MRHHPGIRAYLALVAVCFFWGTTYLGIRMALETFPPLVLVSTRFILSGSILVAAALAVSAAMATALMERRREIGLMKALGASSGSVAGVFHTEAALLALLGGSVGFVLGGLMARQVGQAIFGVAITVHAALLPIVLLAAGAIVLAGSALAIRRAAQVDPVLALRGDA